MLAPTRTALAAVLASFLVRFLVIVPVASAGAVLHWTAPGDDGSTGTATRYEVRRSTQPIGESTFALADTVAGVPRPSSAGRAESCAVALPVVGVRYWFAIKTVDDAGNWSDISNSASYVQQSATDVAPSAIEASVSAPWPNPAASVTRVRLELPSPGAVVLEVFDVAGRHVRTLRRGELPAGTHEVEWDLRDDRGARAAAGLYFVRTRLGRHTTTRRIVIAS